MNLETALDVVYGAIKIVNSIRAEDYSIPLRTDVVLAGEGARLDLLVLVTLVLAVGRRVTEFSCDLVHAAMMKDDIVRACHDQNVGAVKNLCRAHLRRYLLDRSAALREVYGNEGIACENPTPVLVRRQAVADKDDARRKHAGHMPPRV